MQCGRLKVLRLEGTPEERQRNHGSLLGKELSPDPLAYFSRKTLDPVRNAPRFVQWLTEKAVNLWVRALHRSTPDYLIKELNAFAEGAGMSSIDVRRAISVPDIAAFLVKWSANSLLEGIPTAGCTSVAKRFTDGGFAYGRNLDFAGAQVWDQHPLITVHIPPPGTYELKHIAIGADGAGFAGITGFNEAGISFAVHQNYSKVANLGGTPMFLIGDVVLRHARNLEEAIEQLKKLRPSPLWTFVITDFKTGEAIAVETSVSGLAVRKMQGDHFAQTNHLQTPLFTPHEHISIGTKYNSVYRFDLAMKMLAKIKQSEQTQALERLAAILSYQKDPAGNLVGYHDVLKAHTIQTVLFQKNNGHISALFSMDDAPTASGRFAEFHIDNLWDFTNSLNYKTKNPTNYATPVRAKQKAISRAFAKYFDQHDYQGALKEIGKQESLDAKLFAATALYQDGKYDEAISVAQAALTNLKYLSEPTQIRDSLERVQLLALWQASRGPEAKALANKVLARKRAVRPGLHNLAKALVKNGKPEKKQRKITFEFFSGDLGGITEP